MRFVLAILLSCALLYIGQAFAGSAYQDVSREHWAYNALDYLTDRGVVEGYPDGFFKGDRTLTRYEFAQAIARLLDSVDRGNYDNQIRIMAETLRAEFSDQLAELNRATNALGETVYALDARVGDIEGGVADNSARIGDLESKVSGLSPGPDWQGEFRYRWQFNERDLPGTPDRFRQQIRFRLGYSSQINDAVQFAFRFSTQTGQTAVDSNHSLGNGGRTSNIYLDQAYVKYTPAWFGYYTRCEDPVDCNGTPTCGCPVCTDCNPRIEIYAGIFPNILQDDAEMIFDDDVNMQGVGGVYHFNEDFQVTGVISVAVEVNGGDYFDDDTYFFATELKHENCLDDNLDAWVGAYGWKGENNLAGMFTDNAIAGLDFNMDGNLDDMDRMTTNFHTVKGGLQYTFDTVFERPLSVYGEYMMNIDSNAEDNINAVNPFVTPNIVYEDSDDTGWVVGAQYGRDPVYCKQWAAFASYKEIGANAIIDGFGDVDAGGANTNSFEVGWKYMWADNSLIGVSWFLNRMHNAFGFAVPNGKEDNAGAQIDWTFRF